MTFRGRVITGLYMLAAVGIMIVGAGTTVRAAGSFSATASIVFEDGRVMFYKGAQAGLSIGESYDLMENGETVARIELEQVDQAYSIGRVVSFKRELREGTKYEFRSSTGEAGSVLPEEQPKKGALKAESEEKTAAKEEEKPVVKEVAKKSSRRMKVDESETATAEGAADKKKEEPAKKEESKSRTASKKTDTKTAKKPEPKEKKEKVTGALTSTAPGTLAFNNLGLTGMQLIPTCETIQENRSRLSWRYFKIDGSDTASTRINSVGVAFNYTSKLVTNGFSFGYGLSENAEVAISTGKNSAHVDGTIDLDTGATATTRYDYHGSDSGKMSSISIKYRFSSSDGKSKKEEKGSLGIDVAAIASMGSERQECDYTVEGDCERIKHVLYGLAAGAGISDNAKLHGFYGSQKVKVSGHESDSNNIAGFGLEYVANPVYTVFAEYLKTSRETKFKNIGLRYRYTEFVNFDLSYLIYEEEDSIPLFDDNSLLLDSNASGFHIGANYSF